MYEVGDELVKCQLIGVHKKLQARLSRIHDDIDRLKALAPTCSEITPLADSLIVVTDELLTSAQAHLLILQAELLEPYAVGWGKVIFNVEKRVYTVDAYGIPVPVDTIDKE